MNNKLITFYFDEPKVRTELAHMVQQARGASATLLSKGRFINWGSTLPSRVGGYFYDSDWMVLPAPPTDTQGLEPSMFSADRFKTAEQAAKALGSVAASFDWAIFPWGGYARYGMLGVIASADKVSRLDSQPISQYLTKVGFNHQYCGVLGRRTRVEFGPSLWKAVSGHITPPIIITFEYYEEAFEDVELCFKVEGTFSQSEGPPRLSVYRILDFETFKYFAGNANQFGVFDVLPGSLDFDSCVHARRAAVSRHFPDTLQHAPWYLVYNGGEIDTDHVLFVSSDHLTTEHFVGESHDILDFASYF